MTKKHSAKKALIASVLMLAMCFSMLIGTTFAWFTDSVSSANNIIKGGNLDIEVYYAYLSDVENGRIADDAWKLMTSDTPVFDNEALWEPGYTQLVYFKIKNVGSLAAKYQFRVDILSEVAGTNVYGEQFKLSDNIQTYVNACTNRNLFESYCIYTERDIALNPPGAPNPFYTSLANAADGTLSNDEGENSLKLNHELTLRPADEWDSELYATLCLWMPTSVGNEANFLTGTTPPEINLGITVVATQYTYENDSFDNKYDEDAEYPVLPVTVKVSNADEFAEAINNIEGETTIDAQGLEINTATNNFVISTSAPLTIKNAKFSADATRFFELKSNSGATIVFENCEIVRSTRDQMIIAGVGANLEFNNCTFKGAFSPNFTESDEASSTAVFKNCTFKVADANNPFDTVGYVNCMQGTSVFENCTFDYTGGNTNGSNVFVKYNAVNAYRRVFHKACKKAAAL